MNKDKNQTPPAAEFGQLIAYLAQQGTLTEQQIRQIIGSGPDGRTRGQIAEALAGWLRGI